MPDLLLPAFILTLVVNAILVWVAIRALRSGDGLPRTAGTEAPEAPSTAAGPVVPPASPAGARAEIAVEDAVDAPVQPATSRRKTRASANPPAARRTPSRPRPDRRRESATTATTKGRGGRRRFALPPMDVDHERVNRTIETFLTTPDEAAGSEQAADATANEGAPGASGPTTVAVVAIEGLVDLSASDHPKADALAATVERALRSAARSSDLIAEVDAHVYRVTLAGTGELAARAYLRRVRATVDPTLETAPRPVRLATATAAALDGDVDAAFLAASRHVGASAVARRPTADGTGGINHGPERASGS